MKKEDFQKLLDKIRSKDSKEALDIVQFEAHASKLLKLISFSQKIGLQKIWSWIIGLLIGSSTLFLWIFVILLGLNILDYSKYPIFPNLLITSYFVECLGLAYIVVKHLFPKK